MRSYEMVVILQADLEDHKMGTEELAEVVVRFTPEIFPDFAGGLYILNDSRTALTRAGAWLDPQRSLAAFPASACRRNNSVRCWALRGRA